MTTPSATRPAPPPDARRALPWRGWWAGLDEAAERGVPIFCMAEAAWTNGAQRLALVLEQDDATRRLLEDDFVPVLVDPVEQPDVAGRLRWAATALTGTAGPPLLVMLTPGGAPFLAYCSLWPEGRAPYPSLRSLLRSIATLDSDHRSAMEAEAATLGARAPGGPWPGGGWAALRGRIDERFGGLRELPKHPHAPLLWRLLDEADDPAVRTHVLATLDGMRSGGILDQLGGSFHRCARDDRWVVPHFEKLVPGNAALAAVYARAGAAFDRPDLVEAARTAADFAMTGLGSGTMVVAADTAYYTWTPQAFQAELDPALVQALGLHFGIARDDAPQVLFRAMEPEAMTAYAEEEPAVLRARVSRGKARLALARARRPPPACHAIDAPAWRAETLRWLFEARRCGLALDGGGLAAHLAGLLDGPFDPTFGYARRTLEAEVRAEPTAGGAEGGTFGAEGGTGGAEGGTFGAEGWTGGAEGPAGVSLGAGRGAKGNAHWLEDQAAIAAACLAAGESEPRALEMAGRLADVVVDAYLDADSGTLFDAPRVAAGGPSHDVVDHALSAAVPTMVAVLTALGADARHGHRDRARRAAARIRERHLGH